MSLFRQFRQLFQQGPGRHICSVCNKPVKLETTKTNEYGHAVHDECYLANVSGKIAQRLNDSAAYNPYAIFANAPQIPELLLRMIFATGADFGNVQLLDSTRPGLRIVAQHGFGAEFLNYFETVCGASCACGAAMNRHSRVAVSDILTDPLFQDEQTQGVMLRAKVRACQSTPLFDAVGTFIGVCSTHFERPTSFDPGIWQYVNAVLADFTKQLSASLKPSV